MRNAPGYSIITSPGERAVENDVTKCAHFQRVMLLAPGFSAPFMMVFRADGSHYMRDSVKCLNCYQHICPACEAKRECVPFEKKVDEEEKAARRLICQ